MAPRSKRQRSASPSASAPRRRSKRLEAKSAGSSRQQQRGLSVMSTETESSVTWPFLAAAAMERIAKYQPQHRAHEQILQPSLGAFVTWLPAGGRESVARDIVDATTDKDLYDVFHNLLTSLAVPMKARSKQPSVTESPHPRRQANVEVVAATLDQPEIRDPTFRDLCLRRDSNCCVVTGHMDTDYWETIGCPDDINFGPTEGAHIIPFSYASWDKSSAPPNDTSSAWEVLWRCFPRVRQEGLRVETINNPSNGITLRNSVHTEFGKFSIALKPTDSDDTYEVKVFRRYPKPDRQFLPGSGYIELKKAHDAQGLDLPNRALLECHYRLAEILNASGMAEVIERSFREWEDLKGSSCHLLREDGGTDVEKFLRTGLWERVIG
ncbi:hypothetical protein BDV37DRAFT_192651 [Aspergillus pseudonomiae]|uniref:HNH nuclease domain-containing protein n=1 Tax=Aspergillus pseudonomiae TaxID=1506151 RepID=A0A5N7DP89_9EURO|nr:uncharacterized protein BDV37DRAFT_192651 [Aspergillus pseudonomiae]KAE8408287.1 hypothetical protein BDV37DRAFT_192651 [Aspergillus pseudonomiae]